MCFLLGHESRLIPFKIVTNQAITGKNDTNSLEQNPFSEADIFIANQ